MPAALLVVGLVAVPVSPQVSAALDTTPPAMVGATKVTGDRDRIKLDWPSSPERDLLTYRVYRSTTSTGPFVQLTTATTKKSEYIDFAAPAGLPTHYRITAVDTSFNESVPREVSGLRRDTVLPAAPSGLTATVVGTTVVLDWADNTEPDLASYEVSRSLKPTSDYTVIASAVTASTFTDPSARVGVAVYYRVRARDLSANRSLPSTVRVVRPDAVPPAAPRNLTVVAGVAGVTVDWSDNSESDRGGYLVARSSDGVTFTPLTALPITPSTYLDTTATTGQRWWYQVVAVDLGGNRSAATTGSVLIADTVAPAAPVSLVATPSASGIALDWADNTEADLAGYVVDRAVGAGTFARLAGPLTTSAHLDTTATMGVAYTYRVSAVDRSGNTSPASSVSTVMPDTAPPAAPTGLVATGGTTGVSLEWADNTEPDLVGYVVSAATSADGPFTDLTATPVAASAYLDTTAEVGVTTFYRVTAVDLAGNASGAATASGARADGVAPAAPTGVVASPRDAAVSLVWDTSTEADLAGYHVYRRPATAAAGSELRVSTALLPTPGFVDPNVAFPTEYVYTVTAVDLAGNESVPSGAVSATPLDTTAPLQPSGLTVTATVAAVTLDWADGTDADLAGYRVSRATVAGGPFTALTPAPITVSTFEDTTAAVGVTSYYEVVALDTAGNTSAAATASAVRPDPLPPHDVVVALDGSGDFVSVQAALDAAVAGTAGDPFVVLVEPGVYREVVTISKSFVELVGLGVTPSETVISFGNAAGLTNPATGGLFGSSGSRTMLVSGRDVTLRNLTVENSFDEDAVVLAGGEQAVALYATGDRLVFDRVRVVGDLNPLLLESPNVQFVSRSYWVDSYVEGQTDLVWGRGTAVFDRSTFRVASPSTTAYVLTPSTSHRNDFGFLVTDSVVESDAAAGSVYLGRPYRGWGDGFNPGNGSTYDSRGQATVRSTVLPAAVRTAQPWADWILAWTAGRFSEYLNSGPGATVNANRPQLTVAQAHGLSKWAYLAGVDGWNPTGETPPPAPDLQAPTAPVGVTATPGLSQVSVTWSANTEADVAGYHVYRSTVSPVVASAANRLTTALSPAVSFTDPGVSAGTQYHYAVTATDTTGNESAVSATVSATPTGVVLPAHDLLVAADGSGQFTTLSAAIAAATAGTPGDPTIIAIKPGRYDEKVVINKNWLTIIGTSGVASDVVITHNTAAGSPNPAGGTYGTGGSYTVYANATNLTMADLTIENSFDEAAFNYTSEQAVALHTKQDRQVYRNVRLLGNQDTLLLDTPNAGTFARAYFYDCYIEGDVDFIFGRGTAVIDRSTIHALSRGSNSNNGYLLAPSTSDQNPYGILITDSTVTSNAPANSFHLGRPWRAWTDNTQIFAGITHNSRGQATIRNTVLPAAIKTVQPWVDMSPNLWTDGRFSEHQNTGPGAATGPTRPQLDDTTATASTATHYLAGTDNWNPVIP